MQTNIPGYDRYVTSHPVLETSHYVIRKNGELVKGNETQLTLTADPALWLYERYPEVFNGTASFDVAISGVKSYKEFEFVPVVHPATLTNYEAMRCEWCGHSHRLDRGTVRTYGTETYHQGCRDAKLEADERRQQRFNRTRPLA